VTELTGNTRMSDEELVQKMCDAYDEVATGGSEYPSGTMTRGMAAALSVARAEWQEERERLKRELAEAEAHAEALEAKFANCPHPKDTEYGTCGCSYDRPSDVCMVHAPQLAKAMAELAQERAWVDALTAPATAQEIPPGGRMGAMSFARILAARLKAVQK
jgi:hypothetical protein